MKVTKELPAKYCLGVDEMDKQHAELISIIADILEIIPKRKQIKDCDKRLNEIIERLRTFSKLHFNYEETKMRCIHYNLSEAHIEEHKQFMGYINSIKFSKKSTSISFGNIIKLDGKKCPCEQLKDIALFCKDWCLDHFFGYDKMLADAILKYNKEKEEKT